MKKLMVFGLCIFIVACAPATPLPTMERPTATAHPPTATPQSTAIPAPTSTLTPTLEPWMQNLPDSVVSIETEGDVIFGLDGDGERVMEFNLETDHWVELVSYKIVRKAGNESQMSTVELVRREDGTLRLPEELLEWERRNALPDVEPGKLVDFVYISLESTGNYVQYGEMQEDRVPNRELIQLFSIYNPHSAPYGSRK